MNQKWVKPLLLLTAIVIICSALARIMGRGETLLEYAGHNPEIAYATPSAEADSDIFPSPQQERSASPSPVPEKENHPSPGPGTNLPSETVSDLLVEEESSESTHYENGFFYQPLSDAVIARITGFSYPVFESAVPTLALKAVNVISDEEIPAVSYEDLRYMNVLYYDFNGEIQTGELICHKGIAQDLLEIFYELYRNEYQIEKIRLIDEYGGDDTASMEDNNTSCFNYRLVDGTSSLSRHALGCAIDINPFYNPYVVFNKNGSGETYISPQGSEPYADRSKDFPYKIDENDLCYKLFKEHGFTWGGDWNSSKDYQHFQKVVEIE